MKGEFMDENREKWEQIYAGEKGFLKWPDEYVVQFVNKFLKPKKEVCRVFDLGCGCGRHAIYMAKEGMEVSGIDSSENAVRVAGKWAEEENLRAEFRTGDIGSIPYGNDTFDCVLCWGALHYNGIDEIKKTIGEIRRVLKPGGLLFATIRSTKDSRFYDETRLGEESMEKENREKDVLNMAINFFEYDGVTELFRDFSNLQLGHRERTEVGDLGNVIAHWIVRTEK